MIMRPLIAATLGVGLSMTGISHAQEQAAPNGPRDYVIATASERGTYYPVGVALALVTRINLEGEYGIGMQAVTSNGTVENVALMRDGTAQFAIMQALIGHWAWEGDKTFAEAGPNWNLRAVAMLWPDVSHFLIRSDLAETGTVDDLANLEGLGFSIGTLGSGSELSNRFLLENYGFDYESWSPEFLSFAETLTALEEGTIAGANIESGIGVEIVRNALTRLGDRVTLLSVTDEQRERFDAGTVRVSPATIPAGTYPGYDSIVHSTAQPNFLAVDSSVPDEDVYLITRTLFENLTYLCELHTAACEMTLETAIEGLPVPLHPGAERYYREMGLVMPEETDETAAD